VPSSGPACGGPSLAGTWADPACAMRHHWRTARERAGYFV